MEDLHDKDLIARMKAVLHDYEEPYADGSWEEFLGSKKPVPFVNWKWLSVAAMILVAGSVWLFYPGDQRADMTTVAMRKPAKQAPVPLEQPSETAGGEPSLDKQLQTVKEVRGRNQPASKLYIEQKDASKTLLPEFSPEARTMTAQVEKISPPSKQMNVDTAKAAVASPSSTFMDFLREEKAQNKKESVAKVSSGRSKWDFGVEVLPTVSNSALNVGAGLMTEYRLSEHFSVGSGISLVQLQAGKALTPGVSMLSSRQLQSVDANFRGIDIPLNLVYNINKNLYTSVGVSYFSVIQEDSKNTFVAEREVSSPATDPVTGLTANVRTFISETMQEPGSETMLNGKSYLGFFNFSIGRKQEVFKKYSIFIEPFIKVPVGKLSQQDLQLTNGGMKFKVAF
jgi:hypothetical protein